MRSRLISCRMRFRISKMIYLIYKKAMTKVLRMKIRSYNPTFLTLSRSSRPYRTSSRMKKNYFKKEFVN